MAIRKRITADDPTYVSDNVIAARKLAERTGDERGVFDPKHDAFAGSYLSHYVTNRDTAREYAQQLATTGYFPRPNEMRVQDLLCNLRLTYPTADNVEVTYRARIRSPLTGIRAFCMQCKGWRPSEVRACTFMSCPLWPFRTGRNRFRGSKA